VNPWDRDWGDSGGDGPWAKEWAKAAPPPPPPDATALDRAQAGASGVNRGALVNLAGLPVATALNAWDLAKAGTGAVMGAFGAKPENLPELTDRSKVAGSPEWIAKQLEQRGAGPVINPNRPDDPASRYLHVGGQGVAAGMVAPQTLPQALGSAATGAGAMLASEAAGDAGAGTSGQVLAASLLPAATTAAATRAQAALTNAQRTAAQRAVVDANVRAAQEAGYSFPPAQVNPSIPNKVLGGISGKAATEQAASLDNQPITNELARRALKLPENTPLSFETLEAVRRQAGTAYDAVKNFGAPIRADNAYQQKLADLHGEYLERIGAGGGGAAVESLRLPHVEGLLRDVNRNSFSPSSAVELIKRLRSDADGSFRSGNTEAARYQKGVANALEELVGNNLAAANQPELLANFQAARQRIAQSYDVQKALNQGTGNVDAPKMAARQQAGRPLTGELETIANAASFAPLSMREYRQTPPGISALDIGISAGVGGGAAALGAGPAAAIPIMLPVARMLARKAVLSKPYQQYMAKPRTGEPSVLARALAEADAQEGALAASTLSEDEMRRRQPFLQGL
jgi:hypothetical protein